MVSEVYPGVFRISFPMPDPLENVHSYLIEGDEDHVLVDTGWSDFETLLYGVKETGIDPGSITQLVLTHSHPDHTGSVEEVRKHTQAKVFMHPYESLYFGAMKSVETEMRDWFEINGVPKGSIEGLISAFGVPEPPEVDAKIEPEHVFSVGNLRWRAIWTPGHSP
ncbi:MAG: MBL fold metallo-hydrolase, partial [Halobacteria archaeon]|nr:MBL fold metallo-hydrolase [Halobacteria archaeon]